MLENAPTLAIVAVHTEENRPPKIWKQKCHYFNKDVKKLTSFTTGNVQKNRENLRKNLSPPRINLFHLKSKYAKFQLTLMKMSPRREGHPQP